ncbi:MAG: D-alanyl-D-alanine carboxypeptidase [Candidatus Dormibacteraeota bacterium]|nr:D-alanyl-D-alanine carboxypeptidase [Candidatus Dormibacteraeota bacterium]MBV9526586.1 D-alanyl-D-alanine carboxypeptidase [Candidatus Dormibacteraeota bacterium]
MSRLGWSLAAAGAALAAVPALVLLRGHGPTAPVGGVAAATVTPAPKQAAPAVISGLRVLDEDFSFTASPRAPRNPPVVHAAASILVDPDTGRILWQQSARTRLAPASTVKLLTALVTLENFDTARAVTVTPDALQLEWDESKMGLQPGNTLTIGELLTGLLTVSANDAANALADDTVGMTRFVEAMNEQALALGLRDTHVVSPVGLDDPATYSTAYDLAVLASADVEHFPLLRDIVSTQYTVLPATATHPAFDLNNINLLLRMYPAATGIKTGYTGNAGGCEIGMAERDGHRLIDVILNGDYVYSTSKRLLDWGFTQEGLPSQLPPSPSPSPSPQAH